MDAPCVGSKNWLQRQQKVETKKRQLHLTIRRYRNGTILTVFPDGEAYIDGFRVAAGTVNPYSLALAVDNDLDGAEQKESYKDRQKRAVALILENCRTQDTVNCSMELVEQAQADYDCMVKGCGDPVRMVALCVGGSAGAYGAAGGSQCIALDAHGVGAYKVATSIEGFVYGIFGGVGFAYSNGTIDQQEGRSKAYSELTVPGPEDVDINAAKTDAHDRTWTIDVKVGGTIGVPFSYTGGNANTFDVERIWCIGECG
ncbi:MAG TPA: hypothetical protein VFC19_46235 [Candidatus Limnocylindrales bacterium]|nr:hypothetical protein [Candidatus Limnocylindrales bacterium]